MRLQLSLELLVYIALASVSMLASVSIYATYSKALLSGVARYEMYEFVELVNSEALSGSREASFSVFVPEGMCNSSLSGGELQTKYGVFYFIENISIDSKLLCPGGATEYVKILNNEGRLEIEEG